MMQQILSEARAMHDRDVVHRAINSSNIFVGDGGDVVKIRDDYREATSMSETDVAYTCAMAYLTPECLLDPVAAAKSSELADSWSIGCVMLQLPKGVEHFEIEVDDDEEGQLYKILERWLPSRSR